MSRKVHLRRRGTIWHWRRKVPAHLAARFAAAQLSTTLDTGSASLAICLARHLTVASDYLFTMIERDPTLTTPEIERMAREHIEDWLQSALENLEIQLVSIGPRSHSQVQERRAGVEKLLADERSRLAHSDTAGAASMADQLLAARGIVLDKESPAYRRLCRVLFRGVIAGGEFLAARMEGQYDYEPSDPLFRNLNAVERPPAEHSDSPPAASRGAIAKGPKLSELIQEHIAGETRAWTPQTLAQNKTTFRMFRELVGDMPAASVTRAHVSRFMETLAKLPRKYGQLPAFRGKTLPEIVKLADALDGAGPTITLKTINRHLSALSGLYSWAVRHGHLSCANPVTGLIDKQRAEAQAGERRPWKPEELKRLFGLPAWRGCKSDGRRFKPGDQIIRDARFFVPLIGLFAGMRLEEICKLAVNDIRQAGEIWAIDIRANEHGRLKEKASRRVVPVHPELIRAGLIDHIGVVRQAGGILLWPELERSGPDKKLSGQFTKWFGRARKQAKVTGTLVDFHSFRHNVATALHAEGVPESTIADILGHAHKTMSLQRYSAGPALKTLHAAISKITYEGLDLTSLHVSTSI